MIVITHMTYNPNDDDGDDDGNNDDEDDDDEDDEDDDEGEAFKIYNSYLWIFCMAT